MEPDGRARLMRILAAVNIAAIAVVIPGIFYWYIFSMPPGQAPGSRALLVAALIVLWFAVAARPVPTPSGRPWPYWLRALVIAGGNAAMAVVMALFHGR